MHSLCVTSLLQRHIVSECMVRHLHLLLQLRVRCEGHRHVETAELRRNQTLIRVYGSACFLIPKCLIFTPVRRNYREQKVARILLSGWLAPLPLLLRKVVEFKQVVTSEVVLFWLSAHLTPAVASCVSPAIKCLSFAFKHKPPYSLQRSRNPSQAIS